MKKPLNIVSLLAALGLFFMPWMEMKCSSIKVTEQTGVQAITGEMKMASEMENTMDNIGNQFVESMGEGMGADVKVEPKKTEVKTEYVGKAIFIMAAAVLIVLGIVLCAIGKFTVGGGIGAVAGLLLILQIMVGFPAVQGGEKGKEMSEDEKMMMEAMIEVNIKPAMYITILLCFVPLGVSFIRDQKNSQSGAQPSMGA